MKALFLALVLMFVSASAWSANFTWEVSTAAGTVSQDSPTISDAQMDRFLDWAWANFPQYDVTDPDNPVLKTRTNATTADAVREWMGTQWEATKRSVVSYERRQAADTAQSGVAELE